LFIRLRRWLDAYFSGEKLSVDFPLNPQGTPFRKAIWDLLLQIPYGTLTTYGDIAAKAAKQRGLSSLSAQAVGGAIGHNPVSILIPCHRVIGVTGNLTGYAGGLEKKRALLKLEGALI
jgi:methylated-DNA-[protein]-cysteine S-methyltransferase